MPLQQIAINFPPIPVFSVQTDSFVSATFLRYAETAENIPIFSENLQKIWYPDYFPDKMPVYEAYHHEIRCHEEFRHVMQRLY